MNWASAETPTPLRRVAPWLVVAGFALFVLGLATAPVVPGWCSSCHAMRPFAEAQARTVHADLACVRCHGASPGAYASITARQVTTMLPRFVWTLGRGGVDGPSNGMADVGCRSCHGERIDAGAVGRRGLRMRHSSCVGRRASCIECHSTSAHGGVTRVARGFTMDRCLSCHDGEKTSSDCDLCHVAKLPSDRVARGPWAVTHGPNWEQAHGLGDQRTCRACHPADYCRRCHKIDLPHPESFPRTHGASALQARRECLRCHEEDGFCTPCHGMQMPHPAKFLPEHPKSAKSYEDPKCLRCHPGETCEACHTAHTHPGMTDGTLGDEGFPRVGG